MIVTSSYNSKKAMSSLMKHNDDLYQKQFTTKFPSIDSGVSKQYITINNKSGDISKIDE